MSSGRLAARVSRRRLVASSALLMALPLGSLLRADGAALATGLFCLVGVAAGVRTPASGGLGIAQLPDRPGVIMTARTAATQVGYLLGAAVGGAVVGGLGYAALGLVLAAGMAASSVLVLRVDDSPAVRRRP